MTHTQTPWQTGLDGSVRDAKGNCIPLYSGFIAEAFYGEEPAISNAAFIVTAVNAYDKQRALIETLTAALKPFAALATEFLDDGDMANKADDRTVWGFNDHDVSYGDFRRAHAALAAAKEQSA